MAVRSLSVHPPNTRPGAWTTGRLAATLAWLLVCATAALGRVGGHADVDYERWYIVEMMGQRAGWAMSSQGTEGDRITSRSVIRFEIRRGEAAVGVSIEGEFVETAAGNPVSMSLTQRFGSAPVSLDATFDEDSIDVIERGPAGEKRRSVPLPEGAWLPPAAASEYLRQRLAAGAEKIEIRTIDATGGMTLADALKPVTITRSELRPEAISAMGREVAVTRCLSVSSAQPDVKATEWLDELGVPVRVVSALGGISLSMTASDRAAATARFVAPELMVSTFVRPEGAPPEARTARRAAYVVSIRGGTLPSLPDTGVQRIETLAPASARVVIDLDAPGGEADATDPALRAESALVNSDDALIKELAERATRSAADSVPARAEAMRRFVHRYIRSKNLDVGFAGAAEVARTRAGDCTEHAALLAAMLRADGIPSRVAAGLIYADEFAGERGVFAYHMWTQAALETKGATRWVDLDATLPDATPMDATHIALAVSSLADGDTQNVFVSLASLLGRLSVKVEEPPPR